MSQSLAQILVHVIFSTKDRLPLIGPAIEPHLHAYLGGICRGQSSPALAIGGTANHMHLLVSLDKTLAVSGLLMAVKKDSSKWIKTRGPEFADFHWQNGYGVFSIGESQRDAVTAYIERQKERHKTLTFEDELVALAERYGVSYNPRYLWT